MMYLIQSSAQKRVHEASVVELSESMAHAKTSRAPASRTGNTVLRELKAEPTVLVGRRKGRTPAATEHTGDVSERALRVGGWSYRLLSTVVQSSLVLPSPAQSAPGLATGMWRPQTIGGRIELSGVAERLNKGLLAGWSPSQHIAVSLQLLWSVSANVPRMFPECSLKCDVPELEAEVEVVVKHALGGGVVVRIQA
eukprot:7050798-Pyramimonas_sp.AAC.1